ncbi:sulfatase family protein [Cerasicoccus frondis]|uniref:sulfatase family protein n=1 Tax=Cerasicoccus frondis TaxID=490090 RepID=UPI002852CF39|nr:sulfatase [Cerasicoccus frondis]
MSERPNILWISFEDTSPYYGCYGDSVAKTPVLDRFSTESCRWSNAFSTSGVCSPSRSAIITGMYAISIGTCHHRTMHQDPSMPGLPTPYRAVLPPHVKCLPEYFRAAGYYCTNNVKTDYQFKPPLSAWDEQSEQGHWRKRESPDQPFFSVFNLEGTHESGMWESNEQDLLIDPGSVDLPPYIPDTPKAREAMARMHSNIARNDAMMGELLTQLEEDGLTENTIVFHWSDHGPLPRGKRWPYDSGIHIPMIVRWPGRLEAGEVRDELVSSIDLGPTALSLAGIDVPSHMQGRVFIGANRSPEREFVYATRDRHDCEYDRVRAIRDKRYKYIRNYYPNLSRSTWNSYLCRHPMMEEIWRLHLCNELSEVQERCFFASTRPVEELYDLETDPHEIVNLANDTDHADDVSRLSDALDEFLNEVGDMAEVSEETMLNQWYPGGVQPRTHKAIGICVNHANLGVDVMDGPVSVNGPAEIILQSATQGASIVYRFSSDLVNRWRLYCGPIKLPVGSHHLKVIAERIGYESSEVTELYIEVS